MSKTTCVIFFSFLFLIRANGFAQEESINTDRPDQSDGVFTIPKNSFQFENGATFAKGTFMNNFMLRYGVTPSTEIRLLMDAGKEDGGFGMKPLSVSMKQRIAKQHGVLPAMTAVGYVTFEKPAARNFRNGETLFELKMAFENELSDKFSLGYNVGGANNFRDLNLSIGIVYTPAERISAFFEYFSVFTKLEAEHNIDAGLMYVITPKLQIDIACAHSIFDADNRFFATLGIAYLLD